MFRSPSRRALRRTSSFTRRRTLATSFCSSVIDRSSATPSGTPLWAVLACAMLRETDPAWGREKMIPASEPYCGSRPRLLDKLAQRTRRSPVAEEKGPAHPALAELRERLEEEEAAYAEALAALDALAGYPLPEETGPEVRQLLQDLNGLCSAATERKTEGSAAPWRSGCDRPFPR